MSDDDALEAAVAAYLSAEFDALGEQWFHPSERANFIHEGTKRIGAQMRAAIEAYEAARERQPHAALGQSDEAQAPYLIEPLARPHECPRCRSVMCHCYLRERPDD